MKRMLALLLSAVFLFGLIVLPDVIAADDGKTDGTPTDQQHPNADDLWIQIETLENEQIDVRGKNAADTARAAYQLVADSDTTVEGSLEWHGDAFFWRTTDGTFCGYLPRLREKLRKSITDPEAEIPIPDPIVSGSETRGGTPSSQNVAVFQPFYGLDASFTDQYSNEGASIAEALGGTCTVYRTTGATVDQIAAAMENCAVVVFDSHGATDYESGDDCVTLAHTSYIVLCSGEGLTDADKEVVIGEDNRQYSHACYFGMLGTAHLYGVDGTAIANHMSKKAPTNLLWMAICFGMTTDGLAKPLRSKGVQVVYGYSQEVSFGGDYSYEATFFTAIKKGATVRSAVSLMKRTHGLWDPVFDCDSVAEAQEQHAAFPIVVSGEDAYPGKGSVDAEQLVKSKWKAKAPDFLYGDVNCDGAVNAADASRILRSLVKLAKISVSGSLAADVNVDGKLTAEDASQILRRTIEAVASFPADN